MSTPGGAVAHYDQAIQGQAVTGRVVDPRASVMHEFLALIKKIVQALPSAFPEEGAVLEAFRVIESFSRVHLGSAHLSTIRETDPAPIEDVRLRRGPQTSAPVMPTAPIDYAALASAIVEYQRATGGQPSTALTSGDVHTITDAKPSNGPSAQDASDTFLGF